MINSRTELLQVSNAWLNEAKNDLRRYLGAFVEKVQRHRGITNPVQVVADMLAERPETIQAILNGNANNLSLDLFAKLLIATDHCICIQPLEVSLMARGAGMPQQAARPRPAQRPMSRPQRPAPEYVPFGAQPTPQTEERVYNPVTDQFQTPPRSTQQEQVRQRPRPIMTPIGGDFNPCPHMDMPQTPPMGMGYPMPNPGRMMPSPEELEAMEQARMDAMRDRAQEMPQMPEPPQADDEDDFTPDMFDDDEMPEEFYDSTEEVVDADDLEDGDNTDPETTEAIQLVQALKNNPAVANLLRNILGGR